MSTSLEFDPCAHRLIGPTGALPILPTDQSVIRFLMLVEGECLGQTVGDIAQKYGYCRQRYYQLLAAFRQGGLAALQLHKTGPKANYRRTDQAVRQVLRYLFLDPEASPEVVTQKLRQSHFQISLRSVQRIIADYGLQKKTLRAQPPKPASPGADAARRKTNSPGPRRRPQRRARHSPTPGR